MPDFQSGGDLSDYLHKRASAAVNALRAIPDEQFLADPEGCVERVYSEYALEEVTVSDIDGVQSDGTKAARITGYGALDRRPIQYDGMQITIRIPFGGSSEVWRCQPSARFVGGAYLEIDGLANDHFVFVMGGRTLDPREIRSGLETSIDQLKQTSAWINQDLRGWLPAMRSHLTATANERRARLSAVTAIDAALGIPITPTSAEKKIPIPVKRTPLKVKSPTAASGRAPTQHRVLQEDVYQDVLRTIEQMGRAMERTPTAARLKEEELRNLILIVLNANYEGAVRGEVFNGAGKTDLLLNWEGDNAFIGECKVWTGPAKFRAAIGQLLGYVTWRDTKAALVIFIKKGTPFAVLASARAEIENHASFVSVKGAGSETRFDYILQSPSDPERHVDVALIGVVIPPLRG